MLSVGGLEESEDMYTRTHLLTILLAGAACFAGACSTESTESGEPEDQVDEVEKRGDPAEAAQTLAESQCKGDYASDKEALAKTLVSASESIYTYSFFTGRSGKDPDYKSVKGGLDQASFQKKVKNKVDMLCGKRATCEDGTCTDVSETNERYDVLVAMTFRWSADGDPVATGLFTSSVRFGHEDEAASREARGKTRLAFETEVDSQTSALPPPS